MAHTEILDTLQQGSKLSKPEMKRCMDAIMDGAIPDTAIATILTLLQKNGISADEIAGARESLIERATPITLDERPSTPAAQVETVPEPSIFPQLLPLLQMQPVSA